nr:MAG TPA: hypothetical protein [Caudoviricetes sp.]DAW69115.1 MAG TPA: hypothetical protein [Caudoviricetes sp.]
MVVRYPWGFLILQMRFLRTGFCRNFKVKSRFEFRKRKRPRK